jgi:hypothetical protein
MIMAVDNSPRSADAEDGIEVTPEMIEAGCEEIALFESSDPPWSIVKSVYLAMERRRRETALK